jgi:ribonuclease P protein component
MPLTALRGWKAFRAVHSDGRFRRGRAIAVHYLPNAYGYNRYGVAAKSKVGTAVIRNRVRRWTKQLLRKWDAELMQGYDIIVLAGRPEAAEPFADFAEQLAHVLALCRLTAGELET